MLRSFFNRYQPQLVLLPSLIVVTITVYLTDPRLIDPLMPIRREFWPDGNFPASTTITVHSLPAVGMMLVRSASANVTSMREPL